jgi:hypothetical protein
MAFVVWQARSASRRREKKVGRRRSTAAASLLAGVATVAFAAGAGAAGKTLPTLNVALSGTRGVTLSGSKVSGAVSVVSTFHGPLPRGSMGADFALVHLNPGVTIQQASAAVQSQKGDINALTPYGTLTVDAGAPATVQSVLAPGKWVALNVTGNGQPGMEPFTVTKSPSPATLPAASATEMALEFGFRGPTTLRDNTLVRAENHGFLVHMIVLAGARNLTLGDARQLKALLLAGKDRQARKISTAFFSLLNPASPGAMQQQVLNTKPGYYVEACFEDTQDHREHTELNMLRIVKVV